MKTTRRLSYFDAMRGADSWEQYFMYCLGRLEVSKGPSLDLKQKNKSMS